MQYKISIHVRFCMYCFVSVSLRIPEILHHESGVSDYDYASFGTNLPYQPPRDPRQQDHQLQASTDSQDSL